MDALIEKLKGQIIEQLNLAEVKPEEINPDSPFFGVLMSPWWLLVGYLLLLAAAAIRHVYFKAPSSKVIISLLLSFVVSYLVGSVLAFVYVGPHP